MAPKSMPYWKGLIETRVHARRHFQFSSNPFVEKGMVVKRMYFAGLEYIERIKDWTRVLLFPRAKKPKQKNSSSDQTRTTLTSCDTCLSH